MKIPMPVKVGISLLLLGFVMARVDLPALFQNLGKSNPYLFLLATLLAFVSWFLNTYKWQVLLAEPGAHLDYPELLRLNFMGMFYNLVLPGQVGGEVVKGVALARMGVSKTAAAMSIAADRVTGLLAIFVLGAAGLVLAPTGITGGGQLLPWLVGIGFALLLGAVVLVTGRGPAAFLSVGRAIGWPGGRVPERVSHLSSRLVLPSRSLSSLGVPLLLSAVFQLATVSVNLLLCMSFGISVGYLQLLWIVAVVSLVQSLPISIAGIGVREGAYIYLLEQQGVSGSLALALSLSVFAIQVLLALTGGAIQLRSQVQRQSQ